MSTCAPASPASGRPKADEAAHLELDRLEAALSMQDLAALPGNRFESLTPINDQWRICFAWPKGALGPENVEIVDYH